MSNPEYVWWIDERLPSESRGVHAKRLLHYGPYADEQTAVRKIAELKRTERYRKADLVASKSAAPTSAGQ
jgi:predicted GIY-YIG superfamily endonuclease